MKASGACISLIKRSELCRLKAYQDLPGGTWTVGWGHTGPEVRPGMIITQIRADQLLVDDVKRAENAVAGMTQGMWHLTQGQFDAMVSFVFNLGAASLQHSTLLRKFKAGDVAGAGDEFLRWVFEKKNGQEIEAAALLNRRKAERAMFLGGTT